MTWLLCGQAAAKWDIGFVLGEASILSDLFCISLHPHLAASVGDYIWSPTLCCSSSNRRRAFSSRMGAFIRSSSWVSGSRREPSAPGGGSSSSAAAGGLAVVGGLQLLVRGLHQQEEGHSGAGHCSTGLFTRLESLAWSQQGFWQPSFYRKRNLLSLHCDGRTKVPMNWLHG